jgi:hypothetical protein
MPARRGFFWDTQVRQRRDINEALDREDALQSNVDSMRTHIRGLHQDIDELRVTVGILIQMLAEANQVDPTVIRYRVEAALDELHAPPPVNKPASNRMPATITCVRCRREVPPESTVMTADGARCDPACST